MSDKRAHATTGRRGAGPRSLAVRLLERLPSRPAWLLWRAATVASARRRRAAAGPEVDLAAVAWAVDGYELGRLIEGLSEAGARSQRLLVISDSDAVGVAAAAGCRFEHVPARSDWETRMSGHYDELAVRRVHAILADYRVRDVVVVGDVPPALRAGLPKARALDAADQAPAG